MAPSLHLGFQNFKFGVCQLYFFIFPYQTGTATSFPKMVQRPSAFKGLGGKEKMKQIQTQKTCSNEQPKPLEQVNLTNVQIWMLKNAYEQSTIKQVIKRLKRIQKNCETSNPEAVKTYIAQLKCSNAFKESPNRNILNLHEKHKRTMESTILRQI